MKSKSLKIYLLDRDSLPDYFPTHRHNSLFWEALGRTVATFGFLEDVLARAIFAITATTRYGESDIDQAYVAWLATLNRALTDSLSSLIDAYQKAIKGNGKCETENIDLLIDSLRQAATLRNVVCHATWSSQNARGAATTVFVDKKKGVLETPIDLAFLNKLRIGTTDLICDVIDSVTTMGWNFPGAVGLGMDIFTEE